MIMGKTYTTETAIRRSKKDEGFTLIEVMVAISIFAVGMLAVAAMQTSAIRVNSSAGQISELSTWGVDRLEELMVLPYDDPWLEVAGNPPSGTDSAGNTHQVTTSDGYTVSWTITDDSPTQNTKLITITVTGRGKRLRLVSVRSQSL
jgi:type IV pilus assembly protein PilV